MANLEKRDFFKIYFVLYYQQVTEIILHSAKYNTDFPKVFKLLRSSPYGQHWKCG